MRLLMTLCLLTTLPAIAQATATATSTQKALPHSSLQTEVGAPTRAEREWTSSWRLQLASSTIDSVDTSAKMVRLRLDAKVKYLLSDDLRLLVAPSARLQTGSAQVPDPRMAPTNQLILNEAVLAWTPFSALVFKAGALDEGQIHAPVLLDSRPFPGARAAALWGDKEFRGGIVGEASVPTSTSLSTNQGAKEPTPDFSSVGLLLDNPDRDGFGFNVYAGAYAFRNLPSSVAADSALLGNNFTRPTPNEAIFATGFRGLEARARLNAPVYGRLSTTLFGSATQNSDAPAGMNTGWNGGGGFRYGWSRFTDVVVTGEAFRLEMDSAPASLNGEQFSGTNRNGYAFETGLSFGKRKTLVVGRYGESELIYQNSPQNREKFFLLKVETSYADF